MQSIVFLSLLATVSGAWKWGESFTWAPKPIPMIPTYEQREVSCRMPRLGVGQKYPRCEVRDNGGFTPFECFPSRKGSELTGRIRWYCSLKCEGASRMMEIHKYPQNAHACVQFYTYNTERRQNDWYLWLDDKCFRNYDVTFSLWCEFEPVRKRV